MKKTILLIAFLGLFSFKNHAQTVTDIDGNVYNIITIGTQQWLGENLKVTHYRNGDQIPNVTDEIAWRNLTTGAYCIYNNDNINKEVYGNLYSWNAVIDARNIAPYGWHIPSDSEFTILTNYLGGEGIAGGKLKETGSEHWLSPNTGATNEFGFTAVPGGFRNSSGSFINLLYDGHHFSTSLYNTSNVWERELNNSNGGAGRYYTGIHNGLSVRCIKDNNSGIININNSEGINIYPNPARDNIHIDFTYKPQISILSIYDLSGEIIIQKSIQQIENIINTSSVKAGVYIIEISNPQRIYKSKLIIY